MIDGLLDRERARLHELGPVIQREEVLERLLGLLTDGYEIDELPVVLRRKPNTLVMRDAPHRGWIDGPTEMNVKLREFVAKRVRHSVPKASRGYVRGA